MDTKDENNKNGEDKNSEKDPLAEAMSQTEDEAVTEDPAETSEESGEETSPDKDKESPWAEGGPEAEIADLKDKLLRALADNENTIRRAKREREDTAKYAAANFARDMLTVADNLQRALDATPEALQDGDDETKSFLEGIDLTSRELLSVLERHGIKRISPMGEKFDHDQHEALFEVPTSDTEPGTVVQVVEDGFMIHDRLLRAAKVGVSKAIDGPDEGEGHNVDTTA
ncbi:MAG: nucleotide exchange factor GrpE [Rhodospirillaceae bacterium]|nr:nucleotide exchange factor GrpE [Rhodospirillaceae bacterium]